MRLSIHKSLRLRVLGYANARSFLFTTNYMDNNIFSQMADVAQSEISRLKGLQAGDFVVDTSSLLVGEVPPKLKAEEYLRAAQGFIYSCVTAIADEIGAIKLHLYEINNKNGDVTEVYDSEILDTLDRANDYTTKFDLMWLTAQYLELAGEAPLFMSYGPSIYGKGLVPKSLMLLRPDRLKYIPGQGANIIGGYKYLVDYNTELKLEVNEVVPLRYPDPTKQFRGKGTLEAAARTADIEVFSEDYNRTFFYNSARPDSIFKTDKKLTKTQRESIEAKIKQKYRGINNAHKTLILENGLDWKPMALSQKDMDFIEQQRFSRDKILSIFRVPKSVVGITDDVNRANAEAGDYIFAKRKIRPTMQRIVEQLNEFYVPKFDDTGKYFLDFEDPVPENVELRVKRFESGLKNGYYTINEVREMDGKDPIGPNGDKVYLPINVTPIDVKPKARKEYHSDIKRARMQHFRKHEKKEKIKEQVKDEVAKAVKDKLLPIIKDQLVIRSKKDKRRDKKAAQQSEADKKKRQFEQVVRKVHTGYENKFKAAITKVFDKQVKEVLDKMPTKAINPKDYLLKPEDQAKVAAQLFIPILQELIKDQSKIAFDQVGVDNVLSLDNPVVREYLTKRTFKFSFEMTEHTNERLGNTLAEGIKEGESIPQLRRRVQQLFDDMSKYRSERIARTEITRATSFSHEEAYKESKVVKAKEWLTAFDERVCPYCNAMSGKTVALGKNYLNKGDNVDDLKIDYENIAYPPLHAHCRCTLVPVLK